MEIKEGMQFTDRDGDKFTITGIKVSYRAYGRDIWVVFEIAYQAGAAQITANEMADGLSSGHIKLAK